jgi:hypothetical protein
MKPISPALLRKYAGKWVALNRQEDQVLGSGRTFDEAKQAAAATGETSIVLAKAPEATGWKGRTPRWLCIVAVFVSLTQPLGDSANSSTGYGQETLRVQQLDDDDTVADEAR